MTEPALPNLEAKLGLRILDMALASQEGHIPSALSILTIVDACFAEFSFHESNNDFILSKGHGCLALYSVLAELGMVEDSDIQNFCEYTARLGGHPDASKVPSVVTSTGSLGHGLPFGVGLAASKKAKNALAEFVVVLLGDGECNEGTTWESALLATQLGLGNLICIVDYNHSGDRALKLDPLEDKWRSFGWNTSSVDGHSRLELSRSLSSISAECSQPTLIIANTIKGKGLSDMEHNPAWHHAKLTSQDHARFSKELAQ